MFTTSELKIGMIFRFKNCERCDCSGCRFIYYKREVSNTVSYVLKCISDTGHWDLGEATGHNIHSLNNHFTLEQREGLA